MYVTLPWGHVGGKNSDSVECAAALRESTHYAGLTELHVICGAILSLQSSQEGQSIYCLTINEEEQENRGGHCDVKRTKTK